MTWPALSSLLRAGLLSVVAAGASAAEAPSPAAPPIPVASPASQGFDAARLAQLDAFLTGATDTRGYLGAVTLIARNGRLVEWRAFGSRDLARALPMQKDSIFRIYSMTKAVAAVAVLTLMEEGRLSLEDPVSKYLPAFAAQQVFASGTADAPVLRAPERALTLRHLLTHTSGFATGGKGLEEPTKLLERASLSASKDLAEFADRMSRVPFGTDPGTRFSYDGVNTEVLSRVVEVVSGERFDVFLQHRIFTPLKMVDTGFSVPAAQRGRIVDITTMGRDGRLVKAPGPSSATPGEMLNPYFSGAGGLYSTGADYLRFCEMLLEGGTLDAGSPNSTRILGRKSVELMMQNHLTQLSPPSTNFSAGEGFGLGGAVVIDVARRGRLGSLGAFFWSGAASTYFTIDPKERMIAILLMQHLPREDAADLPRQSTAFYNLVYQALSP